MSDGPLPTRARARGDSGRTGEGKRNLQLTVTAAGIAVPKLGRVLEPDWRGDLRAWLSPAQPESENYTDDQPAGRVARRLCRHPRMYQTSSTQKVDHGSGVVPPCRSAKHTEGMIEERRMARGGRSNWPRLAPALKGPAEGRIER